MLDAHRWGRNTHRALACLLTVVVSLFKSYVVRALQVGNHGMSINGGEASPSVGRAIIVYGNSTDGFHVPSCTVPHTVCQRLQLMALLLLLLLRAEVYNTSIVLSHWGRMDFHHVSGTAWGYDNYSQVG